MSHYVISDFEALESLIKKLNNFVEHSIKETTLSINVLRIIETLCDFKNKD